MSLTHHCIYNSASIHVIHNPSINIKCNQIKRFSCYFSFSVVFLMFAYIVCDGSVSIFILVVPLALSVYLSLYVFVLWMRVSFFHSLRLCCSPHLSEYFNGMVQRTIMCWLYEMVLRESFFFFFFRSNDSIRERFCSVARCSFSWNVMWVFE